MVAMRQKAGWIVAAVMGLFVVASITGVVSGGQLDPPGPPGPSMKSLDEVEPATAISTIPFTITEPGSYYLAQPLQLVAPGVGITVQADGVTIDLRGFTLEGIGGAIGVEATGRADVTVRNGMLSTWEEAIILGDRGRVEDVSVVAGGAGSSIQTGATSLVRGLVLEHTGAGTGVAVGPGSRIEDCALSGADTLGTGASASGTGVTIAGCSITGFAFGIEASADQAVITDCMVRDFGAAGIGAGAGARVTECSVESSATDAKGIEVGESAVVQDNSVRLTGTGTTRCVHMAGTGALIDGNDLATCSFGVSNESATADGNRVIRNSYTGPGFTLGLDGTNDVGVLTFANATNNPWANMGQ
jgi:hypothetical protein